MQSTQRTKKPRKRHIACPKVRFGEKVLFWGHCSSLEVIWRSFGDSKLKCDKRNRLSVHKNLWKDILHAPKWDLVRKLCVQVLTGHLGHLEVIWRSFGDSELKSYKCNGIGVHKNLWKDILHAPKWDLVRKICFQVLMGHLRSFRGHLEVI